MEMFKLSRVILILILVFLGLLFRTTVVVADPGLNQAVNPQSEKDRTVILSLLEQKTIDPLLLKRAREKLLSLDEHQTRLIASLSEHVKDKPTAGADLAYLLVAFLITLS